MMLIAHENRTSPTPIKIITLTLRIERQTLGTKEKFSIYFVCNISVIKKVRDDFLEKVNWQSIV